MKHEDMPNLKMIHLHTNAQLWTSKLWETIHEDIRSLITEAEISIDAASSETYSINRRGGVIRDSSKILNLLVIFGKRALFNMLELVWLFRIIISSKWLIL
jgi:hypothetical protein